MPEWPTDDGDNIRNWEELFRADSGDWTAHYYHLLHRLDTSCTLTARSKNLGLSGPLQSTERLEENEESSRGWMTASSQVHSALLQSRKHAFELEDTRRETAWRLPVVLGTELTTSSLSPTRTGLVEVDRNQDHREVFQSA
ncbi:hypothetical protein LshimejAT787_0311430 [Lyophyllum shimeji]|uniref:Uncharacterized protein n=1 Tax=Lyophyllum shimeji TaxID=47721 RepID=A0A9P3PK38_LYOSH|nr:hypothetical protein LshimejAT787_0311430 [Lyophyllum shimeji]